MNGCTLIFWQSGTRSWRIWTKLRAAGKNRGATYQQLLAQKLTVQNLIGRFEIYGIKET